MLVLFGVVGCTQPSPKKDEESPTTVCVTICGVNQAECLNACPSRTSDACVKSCSDPYRDCVKACTTEAEQTGRH